MLLTGILLNAATPSAGRAEVILHGASTPLPGAPTGNLSVITVNGNVGQTKTGPTGNNLFHSFSVFNILPAGQSASGLVVPRQESVTFTPPTVGGVSVAITNVISRVTGGTSAFTLQKSSLIDGQLNSSIPGANFWFINPNGIIFGNNARLNVGGSFFASTADYIKLSDTNLFTATPSTNELLTSAPPSAFGFLNANPAGIQVGTTNPANILSVPTGRTLSLVGGRIDIGRLNGGAPGFLLAPAGRVNLVSVASAGEATFNPTTISGSLIGGVPTDRDINVDNFAQLGTVNIVGGVLRSGTNPPFPSVVDGKEIFVRSGQLVVNNAVVNPGYFNELQSSAFPQANDGGQIRVITSGDVTITGTLLLFGNRDSGIHARAGTSSSSFLPSLNSLRDAPDIIMESGGKITVGTPQAGQAVVRSDRFTGNTANPTSFGNVTIKADTLEVAGGGQIAANNFFNDFFGGLGRGGTVTVDAREVVLSGEGASRFTGLATQSDFHNAYKNGLSPDPLLTTAGSGNITVKAQTLTIKKGASISSDSFALGPSGDIQINVGDMFLSRDGAQTGSIAAQSTLAGKAGNISIDATGRIEIDEARISATSGGTGDGGSVNVTADKSITISGQDAGIISLTAPPNRSPGTLLGTLDNFACCVVGNFFNKIFHVSTPDFSALVKAIQGQGINLPDNAGWIEVLAALNKPPFSLTAVADLTPGNGGQISVITPSLVMNAGTRIDSSTLWDGDAGQIIGKVGNLTLNDGAQLRSQSGGVAVSSGQPSIGNGNGGSVTLTVDDSILITGSNSAVSTNTFGGGDAGNISLSANQINVQNGGSVTSESGGTLASKFFVGTGNAGQITVSTPTLTMADGGAISVKTSGAGNAGTISLNVADFTQSGGSRVDSSTSGAGSGGDITVTAADSASISGLGTGLFSTASSTGAGGNINVQAPQVQIVDGAIISANSTGTATATAGNVNIVTSDLNMQNGSITTEAALALGGNITITTTGSLVHLTDSEITTSVHGGGGKGGDIAINSDLVILDNSRILANAFGGPGGNINITADVFLVNSGGQLPTSLEGIVDASSALSTPGTINIQATFTDVTGEVAQLPETPLRATELLRAACAARFVGGKASSLVLGGRDGVPIQPGGLLPSSLYLANEAGTPSTGARISANDLPVRFSLLGSAKDGLSNRYSLLPNAKCAF